MTKENFSIPNLDKISYESDILSIDLDFGAIRKVMFFSNCIFFKVIEESYALKTLENNSFDDSQYIFEIENTELLDWFHNESYRIYENTVFHYRILCLNHIIDLLSSSQIDLNTLYTPENQKRRLCDS